MKKLFLFPLVLMAFAGVFGLSVTNASAEEVVDQNEIVLELGKEFTQSKTVLDENGVETTISITKIPEKNDDMVQVLAGSKVINNGLADGTYRIERSNLFAYVRYNIRLRDKKIVSATNLDYRLPGIIVGNHTLTYNYRLARLDMDVSTDIGGLGTLGSWRGRLSAAIAQGMIYISWN